MVDNNMQCSDLTSTHFNTKCKHDSTWATNKYCQQTCFDNDVGYDGDCLYDGACISDCAYHQANGCRDPNIAAAPIYIDKYAGFRCSNGTSHANAGDKSACVEAALAVSHSFISFNNATRTCESTTTCSTRTEDTGWNVFKEWLGAFSATQVDEFPACDGPLQGLSDHSWMRKCVTQVEVDGTRDTRTCTSCKPGSAFVMSKGASRTGRCVPYSMTTRFSCIVPKSDDPIDPSQVQAKL